MEYRSGKLQYTWLILLYNALVKEFSSHSWLLIGKGNRLEIKRFRKAEESDIQKLKVCLMLRKLRIQYANGYKAVQVKVSSLFNSRASLVAAGRVNISDLIDQIAFTLATVIENP